MTWLRAIMVLVSLAALAYLVVWDARHPQISLFTALLAAQLPSAIAVAALAYRSRFLSRGALPFSVAVKANGLAIVGTLLLPARLSELGKPFYFQSMVGFAKAKGLALVVEERIWDFVLLAMLVVFVLWLWGDGLENTPLSYIAKFLAGIAALGLAGLLALPKLVEWVPLLGRLNAKFSIVFERRAIDLIGVFGITTLAWSASVSIMWLAYAQSGLPALEPAQILLLFTAATLGLVVAVTPGSVGTYEGAIVAVLMSSGVALDAALAFAIGFRFCWLAIPLLAASWALWQDSRILSVRTQASEPH